MCSKGLVVKRCVCWQGHACAVDNLGKVHCWGQTSQINGTPESGHFVSVDASMGGACGILETGNIICWGSTYLKEVP